MTSSQPHQALPDLSSHGLKLARWFLALLLLTSYPLATVLPATFGWENGPIENMQILVLLAGFVHALWQWRDLRNASGTGTTAHRTAADTTVLRLCLIAIPLWLMCAARETSWGATLITPGIATPEGPYFSSSTVWYHAAIKPLVLLTVACAAGAFLRWRLDRPLLALMRQRRFPWAEIALIGAAALLSTTAEGNLPIQLPGSPVMLLVLEEAAELVSYLSLFLAQLSLFNALRRPSDSDGEPLAPGSPSTRHAPDGAGH